VAVDYETPFFRAMVHEEAGNGRSPAAGISFARRRAWPGDRDDRLRPTGP